MTIDKNWRPADWVQIKLDLTRQILTWSPSKSRPPDTTEQLIEQTASKILGALLEELARRDYTHQPHPVITSK